MTISYSKQLYSNNASTELLYGIGPEDTSISVLDASKFPTPGAAEFFTITLDDGVSLEIIQVGGVVGNALTQLIRGVEGLTPRSFTSGTMVEARLTSAAIRDFARTLDIMTPISLVTDLAAPETLNNHSYVISEGDDTGSPIVATVGGNVWHLLNYPVQRVSQEATAITSTLVEYTSVDDLSTVFTTKGLVVQFTTGANRGQCRLITSATSTTLSWTTPLVNTPSSGDTFTVCQSIASKFQTFIGVDVVTLTQVDTAVEDGISAHIAATNPHPQYTTDAEAATIAGSAVSTHAAATNPHPQYTTDAEAATIAGSAVSTHAAATNPHPQYTTAAYVSNAVAAHTVAPDPHPQYTTAAYVSNAVAAHEGALDPHHQYTNAMAAHEGAIDPHPQYATAFNAMGAHTVAPDPHPQYTTATEVSDFVASRMSWVSFNGHTGEVFGSWGVIDSPVNHTGPGCYTIYFKHELPSSTYCVNITLRADMHNYSGKILDKTTTSFSIATGGDDYIDFDMIDVSILF